MSSALSTHRRPGWLTAAVFSVMLCAGCIWSGSPDDAPCSLSRHHKKNLCNREQLQNIRSEEFSADLGVACAAAFFANCCTPAGCSTQGACYDVYICGLPGFPPRDTF